MSVIRVNKTKDFTVMSNHHLRNENLSLKAKGLLSLMLSLPDDWNYSVAGLCAICKENETAIKSTIKELKQYEYIFIDKLLPDESDSKKLEYIYNIYENPEACRKYKQKRQKEKEKRKKRKNQEVEKQGVGFLGVDFQPIENQRQLNTNKLNTNNKDASNSDELKDCVRMDASFPKEKEDGYVKLGNKNISKTKYTQSELESYLPNKIRELYLQENLSLDEYTEELVNIVMYFYRCHRILRKEKHPLLTDISYEKIVIGYLNPPETMSTYGEFTFEVYKEMIDKYFNVDFGKYSGTPKNFNYRISHFMSDTIREHLYRQLIES